jgi:hypothetical protein
VPLHVPAGVVAPLAGVAAPPGPQLSYRGGPLITAVEVFTLFWGDAWRSTAVPQPIKNTLYFIYLPPGVALVQGGGKSCQAFCGYHDAINGQIFYAAMPYPGCAGCTGGLAVPDAITSTSSHELCEAITDPIPGQGWYDDVNGEIGDICAWKTKKVGTFTVQLEWSNKANACV